MNEDLLRRVETELEKVRTSYMYDTDRGELYEQVTLLSRALVQMTQERDAYKGFYEWWASNRESDIDDFIEEAPLMAGPEDLAACVKALKAIRALPEVIPSKEDS